MKKIRFMKVALDVKALREARGWSAEQLVKEARVHPSHVELLEKHGKLAFNSLQTMRRIADALKIDCAMFFPAGEYIDPAIMVRNGKYLSGFDREKVNLLLQALDGMTIGQADKFLSGAWNNLNDALEELVNSDTVEVDEATDAKARPNIRNAYGQRV